MDVNINEHFDFERLNLLLEGFNQATGFVTAILDLEGNILSKSGWRKVCTDFHRANKEPAKNCRKSDTVLANKMSQGEDYYAYKCLNGLIDVVVPIVIKGKHFANLFTGQFFFEEPSMDFFKKQAKQYNFDENLYLSAVKKVPVVSEAKVKATMRVLVHIIEMISDLKVEKMEQQKLNSLLEVSYKKIKQQKDRLDFILEGTNTGTWVWNIQTGKIFFNEKWVEMLGYKLKKFEPITIEDWINLTHPDDFKRAKIELEKHLKGETDKYNVELRMKHKAGQWVWFNARGIVISWTKENKPLKMFGIQLDITERKKAEKEIKETKNLLQSLINKTPGVVFQHQLFPNGDSSFPYATDDISDIYEITPEEAKNDVNKVFDRIHPQDKEMINASIKKSADNLTIWKEEYRLDLPDKGIRWVEGYAEPEKRSDGSIVWYGNIRDINERKEREKKLHQQKEILEFQHEFQKTLAELSSDLLNINSTNIDGKINNSLAEIGKFFDVDRSYIVQLSEENGLLSNTHEWCKKGVKSEKENFQNIPSSVFPWSLEKLTKNQHINIEDVYQMPKKAEPEQSKIKVLGIKSLIIIPMFIENDLFGFFIFDTVKNKRKFSDKEIRLIKIFTDTIRNAFSKYLNDKRIRELTYKDRLTGLYNRRFLEEELERLDTERQLPISIILADINGLKIINDSLGHQMGDQLLKKSAKILEEAIRKEDILARQGGDEFAILLPKTDKETTEEIIKRINKKSKKTNNDKLAVTMALGNAVKTNPNQNLENVLRAADNDMYQNKLLESRSAKSKIVQSLLNTLEIKSNETKEHSVRIAKLALEFGKKLNLSNSELNKLSLLSTLHDIGKTTIAEKILKKPERLTDKEWKTIKEHPERGFKIANSSEEFALIAEEIFAHHERWDGSGYPRQLKEEDIPYLARIITIIDAYDVMTHARPYSSAISKKDALKEIKDCAGSQFDPKLAEIFIKMLKKNNILENVQ